MKTLEKCELCPKKCNVDRNKGVKGFCGADSRIVISRAALHFWEEPCISGDKGSGAVFFSGCNLKCVYCQNFNISRGNTGRVVEISELADIFIDLMNQNANNINLVTPTHYVPQIVEAIKIAKGKGLNIPIVYNTSGYESVDTLKMLEGYVDIYLPDFKYMNAELAKKYSNAYDYPEVCKAALKEMFRQVGTCKFDAESGIMKKGIIVRHLILPGFFDDSKKIIEYLHSEYGNDIFISIMNQYTPLKNVEKFPEINRKISDEEYNDVVNFAVDIGVENGFIQDGDTAQESFIPEFECESV